MAVSDSLLPKPVDHDADLPMPMGQQDLPAVRDDFADLVLLPAVSDIPSMASDIAPTDGFADFMENTIASGLQDEELGDLEWAEGTVPSAAGAADSMEFGELDLDTGDQAGDDDLEFAGLPEADHRGMGVAIPGAVPIPGATRPQVEDAALEAKKKAWLVPTVVVAALTLGVLGFGFSLTNTKHGLFGQYTIEKLFPAAGHDEEVYATIAEAEAGSQTDTFEAVRDGTYALGTLRKKAGLNRQLLTRSVVHESLFEVRFGGDPKSPKRLRSIMRVLKDRKGDAPKMSLAIAANALSTGNVGAAADSVAAARNESPDDPYVEIIAGEVALLKSTPTDALKAFTKALKLGAGTRAQWGIARALVIGGDKDAAEAATAETLRMSPKHAAARIAAARTMLAKGDNDPAYEILQAPAGFTKFDGQPQPVSRLEQADALTLVGEIEESRGRRGAARANYEKAALLSTKSVRAKLGAGRLLLAGGNPRDALIRFDAVIRSGAAAEAPSDESCVRTARVEAILRATEALTQLDRTAHARKLLKPLDTKDLSDPEVALWLGRAAAMSGQKKEAIRKFKKAIKLDRKSFKGYAALAQFYVENEQASEAVQVLKRAEKYVPMTAKVRRLRGESALHRNRASEAISEYRKAIALEPKDAEAHFGMAKAYRKSQRLEDAEAMLEKVRVLDPLRIGIEIERGLIAEARGDLSGAADRYKAALEKTPESWDLRTKLGALLVKTGSPKEGKVFLDSVLEEQPHNAEAIHYLGRVALQKNQLVLARQLFTKAIRLEPQNGEFRMYVGWTALESNELAKSMRHLNAAINMNPMLPQAYWLRARLRFRTGAVKDALKDLQEAVKLDPTSADTHATMAASYEQLTEGNRAIESYRKAVELDDSHPLWWYRLARLELNEGKRDASLQDALRAIDSGTDNGLVSPGWLADAHRLAAELFEKNKKKEDAIHHYQRFWDLATMDHVERVQVRGRLEALGNPPLAISP